MKLTTILLFSALLQVSATSLSLGQRIILQKDGISIDQVFREIRKQTGYDVLLIGTGVDTDKKINVNFFNTSLQEVLVKLLEDSDSWYVIEEKHIIIKDNRQVEHNSLHSQASGKIAGRITDAQTGEVLIGASVRVEGQPGGALSDQSGHFTLDCKPGIYTVIFTYIGYKQSVISNVAVKENEPTVLNVVLEMLQNDLSEVEVKADRVITTTNEKLVGEMRKATGITSGISSEQITIGVDRSASEVAQRVAGITLQNGFISIRGMTPRYNPVYLNNAYLPSTSPNKRAFNFDLLPSNVIDRILVYKTPVPELPADFAGGVVKVFTKSSVPVKRLEVSINGQYRTGNNFFGNYSHAASGKYDWLGIDDGTRALPASMPRNKAGVVTLPSITDPDINQLTNEVVTKALMQRAGKAWNIQQSYYPADILADATYYTWFNLGKMKLSSVTLGRYERQRTYFKSNNAISANRYDEDAFDAGTLLPYHDDNYRLSYDSVFASNVRLAAMQQLSLIIDKDNEINATGLINNNTKDVLQINTQTEWQASNGSAVSPRRFESSYNVQRLKLVGLDGRHNLGGGVHSLFWNGCYSDAANSDPNQFSNVYYPDAASINGSLTTGSLNITPATTWQLSSFTRRNTTVGRFVDGEGNERRWQGTLDYELKPFAEWKDVCIKAGFFYEDRKKSYLFSSLAFKDLPTMPFSANPWTTDGDYFANYTGAPVHVEIQTVGLGGSETSGYNALFRNSAGYLATNIPVRFTSPFNSDKKWQLDVYGGVRLEYSERRVLTTEGKQIRYEYAKDDQGNSIIVGTAPGTYQNFWLPSVNATLHLNEEWQIRAAYGKTLNRPELREISPFVTYTPADGFTYVGKPTLKDARIDNFDLRAEWYPEPGEMVSIGTYHKSIKLPIEEINRDLNTGVSGYGPDNLEFARIWGAEIEVRKSLKFMPALIFQRMGIIVNVSYNLTETSNKIPNTEQGVVNYYPGGTNRPFQGAAPWIVNAGLFYDFEGTRISAQYNVSADRLMYNTGDGIHYEPWVFERTRHLVDLSVLQKITSWVSVRLAAQNLLNTPIRWYTDGDFNMHFNTDPHKVSYETVNPGNVINKKTFVQGDYYIRNYQPGVYYTVGFLFNINGKTKK